MEPKDESVEEGVAGLLNRALNKGAILNADLLITVNDIPLVAVRLQAAIANMELMVKYGIMTDWDPAVRHIDDEYLAQHGRDPTLDGTTSEEGNHQNG
ncbi:gas vesicle protein GvpJ [Halalkalicoccus subterraneus]|uniref:gas vesicle protein GvpJ n=1 Tax=Halalkalicoccus subterraneus TaxID=2675002 RepID=UPI000EFB0650|nr:gas vesicle protein GvpJ [Halalkalicoccus subterraneus]